MNNTDVHAALSIHIKAADKSLIDAVSTQFLTVIDDLDVLEGSVNIHEENDHEFYLAIGVNENDDNYKLFLNMNDVIDRITEMKISCSENLKPINVDNIFRRVFYRFKDFWYAHVTKKLYARITFSISNESKTDNNVHCINITKSNYDNHDDYRDCMRMWMVNIFNMFIGLN